jgi:hypothetical protein
VLTLVRMRGFQPPGRPRTASKMRAESRSASVTICTLFGWKSLLPGDIGDCAKHVSTDPIAATIGA